MSQCEHLTRFLQGVELLFHTTISPNSEGHSDIQYEEKSLF